MQRFDKDDTTADPTDDGLGLAGQRSRALFRLTVSFMVLVVMTFMLVEGWRIWRDYRHAFDAAHDSVTNLARATAQHAEDAIRQVDALTAVLGERLEGDGMDNIDVPRIHALLQEQAAILPQLHGLFVYDADGDWVVTDKDITPANANNRDRDYFIYHRTHLDSQVRIGAVVKSRSTDDYIIPVSRRLNGPDGSFAGVLLGTVRVSYFVDYYGDFKIDHMGALVLALRDGTIITRRPFDASVIGESLADSEIFRKYLPTASSGVAEVRAVVDGTWRLYGYRELESYPMVVEAGLSREFIVQAWRNDLIKTGVILLMLLAGLGGLGMVVLRQLRERMVMEQEIRRAHQAVRDMALTDSLTGLGNRRRLDMVLNVEIARAKRQGSPLALAMLDIDYFKRFNDRYGHPAGDDCLCRVAKVIKETIKRPADLAVRYGGEEFTILLPGTDGHAAGRIIQNILDAIRGLDIEHLDHPSGRVTASAGLMVSLPGDQTATPASMIKAADALLYVAKHKGRDRWYSAESLSREGQHSD
ncbi:sensor domain-containing diguanylate cyclase [Pseudomonas sp. JDS28PS106]|uniref:sensor domain-containing diguanylate cyclase n=1 Tax=Pseudomonas sp. JDS28PS106 TaxID=2497235 RepID=UPI003FA713E5